MIAFMIRDELDIIHTLSERTMNNAREINSTYTNFP